MIASITQDNDYDKYEVLSHSTILIINTFVYCPVPANLQFAGAEYGDLQSLSMTVALMTTSSFSAVNIVVSSEKQGQNVYFQHYNANILGWRIANLPKLRLFFQNYQKIA